MTEPTYTPADNLDAAPVAPYTWAALVALCEHWELPTGLRELADGRVILADWDPASDEAPTLVAERDDFKTCPGCQCTQPLDQEGCELCGTTWKGAAFAIVKIGRGSWRHVLSVTLHRERAREAAHASGDNQALVAVPEGTQADTRIRRGFVLELDPFTLDCDATIPGAHPLTAEHGSDGWSVVDDNGGRWWPDEDAEDEIQIAAHPELTAILMAATAPMRGAWHS